MDRREFLATAVAAALAGRLGPGPDRRTAAPQPTAAPRPTAAVVSRWDVDPWARGSYSALPVGCPASARQVLADASVGGRIVLAGEFTDATHPSTVHGAYASGRRAARRLLRRLGPGQRVAVVGAGMAGLAAARLLADAGLEVVVVEARDRVGGRVCTDTSLGVPVELGASWVHGVTGNDLVPLVRAAGLRLVPTDWDDAVAGDAATGRRATGAWAAQRRLLRAAAAVGRRRPVQAESVAAGLARRGWRARTPVDRLAERTELVMEYGLDLDRLGAQALWEGGAYRGGDAMVAGGFDAVPRMLAVGLDVRMSTAAHDVALADPGVLVSTDDGDLRADAAVVAVPLALLQAQLPRVALPPEARRALRRLTTGNLEKVALSYPRGWWPRAQLLQVAGTAGGRWCEWYDLAEVSGRRGLVLALSGGSTARARPRDDATCADEAARALERGFRNW